MECLSRGREPLLQSVRLLSVGAPNSENEAGIFGGRQRNVAALHSSVFLKGAHDWRARAAKLSSISRLTSPPTRSQRRSIPVHVTSANGCLPIVA